MRSATAFRNFGWFIGITALLLPVLGCQTTSGGAAPPPAPPEPMVVKPTEFSFTPQTYLAPLQTGEVRYRMLYAPESHAIWLTDEVNTMKLNSDLAQGIAVDDDVKLTAQIARARFIVIECRLESAFADSSVAYDVVGLRNMEVYLETPAGDRVFPIQRIMAPHADQTPEGALVRFARTTILVFPKVDVLSKSVSPVSGAPSVRLVMDGFHSTFHCEWQNAGDVMQATGTSAGTSSSSSAALEAIRTGYTSIYSLLSPLQRIVE